MSKSLVIAEKPSVAADIARALGGFEKKDDFFEREDMVVGSAVGHLLEIKAPEEFEVKRGKWTFNHLPVIPPHFDLSPLPKSEQKLKTLARLIKRKDVDRIINACDAGREGELIFRTITQYTKAKQPISRLWLQSMTPAAIRDAFEHLRTDEDMAPLADAARCRSEADWLVGINGTRAMTAFNSKEGGFFLTTVGRVQTPTLSIVVSREEQIRKFVAKSYFEVHATFDANAGPYGARWVDPGFEKSEANPDARAERLWSEEQAKAIVARCQGKTAVIDEESKPSSQAAPALFDLTSLQREANARFGFSAKNTLGLAQALYEKHKVLTYPRTDSKALPEDYIPTVKTTLENLTGIQAFASAAQTILKEGWVKPNKRIFDNSKVSDHFAIIPTGQLPKSLSEPEHKLYELVCRRFMAIFFPAAQYLNTTRWSIIGEDRFKSEGKVLVHPGWLSVYGKEAAQEDDGLVAVETGETPLLANIQIEALQTKPPARYSEATLLSAMEGAGKLVDDDDLRDAMAGKGLGTPATRAAIIEGLLTEKYLYRDGREMVPTAKAFQLMTLLRGLDIQSLSRPELTGEWEFKLRQIEQGVLSRQAFMQEIAAMTDGMVAQAKNYSEDTIPGDYATLSVPCPKCGGVVKENYRRFACTSCDFSIGKTPGGRTFEVPEVESLLKERHFGPVDGFRSKMGRPFAASLQITEDFKLAFDFGESQEDNETPVDFSGQTSLGACPKCSSAVYPHGTSYVCEKSVGPQKTCDFRSGLMILSQTVSPEQMQKLLASGKTDLLDGFVSARTKRKFKAYLVKTPEGKIGFEFEQRAPKAASSKASGKTTGKTTSKSKAVAKPKTEQD
ncbi:DNA topoisomerase III [Betaproteobacteria bacterium LSUCC0115]|nr:DNA topoisomerase III [Burkholderiales bacterium LSUCC0115]